MSERVEKGALPLLVGEGEREREREREKEMQISLQNASTTFPSIFSGCRLDKRIQITVSYMGTMALKRVSEYGSLAPKDVVVNGCICRMALDVNTVLMGNC